MRPSSAPLASFEVSIRCGGASFSRLELVRIHAQTHGAARHPPLESGFDEFLRNAFLFGLRAHQTGSRDNHRAYPVLYGAPFHDRRNFPQVFDSPVRARADEHRVDVYVLELRAGIKAHVFQASPRGGRFRPAELVRMRHRACDRKHILRAGSPSDDGSNGCGVQNDFLVETRAVVGSERFPPCESSFVRRAFGRMRSALDVIEGFLVRRDEPRPGAPFYRHVAHRHPAFHRKGRNRFSAIFDHVAGPAGSAGFADDRKSDVLGSDAGPERAFDFDLHIFRFFLNEGLGCKHVFDFARADAVRERAECAVRRRVAVSADDRHSGLRPALLRTDYVHDALAYVVDAVVCDSEVLGVVLERFHLNAAFFVADAAASPHIGRDVVIRDRDRLLRPPDLAPG